MWWNKSVFYQVYISKFNDSDGDGIGDIQGIINKLNYFESLGIDSLWITPFFPHSTTDGGYDVKDYCNVSPEYGSIGDFKKLIKKAHEKEIKIVIDLVINHSSTEHVWFKKSERQIEPFDDYYIWSTKANNWESFFGGSAWEFSKKRKTYYYSSFSRKQADLNWSNEKVVEEFHKIIKFWLNLGVDGFRFDVINNLTTEKKFRDNPTLNNEQIHVFDRNQKKLVNLLKRLFQHIPDDICKIAEISSNNAYEINSYLKDDLFDLAFSFNFLDITVFNPTNLAKEIKHTLLSLPQGKKPTLVFSSHDAGRAFNRLAKNNADLTKIVAFFLLTAYGIPFIYQGEEFGMKNKELRNLEDIEDIQGISIYNNELSKTKDKEIALSKALLKTRDYSRNFVEFEKSSSSLEFLDLYKDLIQLRKSHSFNDYPYNDIEYDDFVLKYNRGEYLFVLNMSDQSFHYNKLENYKIVYSTTKNRSLKLNAYEAKILKKRGINNEN